MGSTKNLINAEGIKKLRELAESAKMCHLATALSNRPISTRPMSVQKVDDDGNIWFFSPKSSEKNADITIDPEVQLFFSQSSNSEFLSVFGTAEVVYDRLMVEELWNVSLKTWFNKGKDDPEITLIKVTPIDSHYWDTKNNRMVQLIKILAGAIVGKPMDDSVEGNIRV
jgi:general stress protein 26